MVGRPSKFSKEEAYVAFAFSQFAYRQGLDVSWALRAVSARRDLSPKSYESVRRVVHGTGPALGAFSGWSMSLQIEVPGAPATAVPVDPETAEPVQEAWRVDQIANMARWRDGGWEPYRPRPEELALIPEGVLRRYLEAAGRLLADDQTLRDLTEGWRYFTGSGFDDPVTLRAWIKGQAAAVRAFLDAMSAGDDLAGD